MTLISRQTIDAVFEAARVEEVISDFVQLKKSGSNFKGLSPFTDERSPSFMVSPVKQIWKDFSSGKGGTAVSFLMEHEHFTYPEAIRYLAQKYNIEIEETEQTDEDKAAMDARESMFLVNTFAAEFFERQLNQSEEGRAIALSYFVERGFTPETIKTFQLGYSPDEWQAFTDEALEKGYQLEFLEQTGLTIVKEDKKFDRFKGRVMFPIHSLSGRILGFGGRILGSSKTAAKYLNSPESSIYSKGKVLYGIYFAKQQIAKEDNCYLVEGYTDVIQLHQKGITNVVASSGTALTPDQIRLISRLTNNITVLFDGDAAGARAAMRGIDLILEQGMNVRVCSFPDGEDPYSFAKEHSKDVIDHYLKENSKDFITYKARMLMAESNNDPVKKAATINDMVNSISKIPNDIQREVYIRSCAQIMDIGEAVLFSTLAQLTQRQVKEAREAFKDPQKPFEVVTHKPKAPKVDIQYELERKIIELLLLYGNQEAEFEDLLLKETESGELELEPVKQQIKVFEKIFLDLQEDEMVFSNEQFKGLYFTIIESLNQNPSDLPQNLVSKVPTDLAEIMTTILMDHERYHLHDWERKNIFPQSKDGKIGQLVNETILSLRCFLIDLKIMEFQSKTNDHEEDHKEILEDVMNYSNLKRLLSRKLNRVL